MKIGLIDCDSHHFPNLPLMKISAYHKQQGDEVEFARIYRSYDELYVSKVFTESHEPELPEHRVLHKGGSGYNLKNRLPDVVEHMYPDYSLYPKWTKDIAYGFLTRGCPRTNHGFCITPEKDGYKSVKSADLSEFWDNQKKIILLDQNLLACTQRMELLGQLADSKALVNFNGGLDIRFLNDELIDIFRKIRVEDFHFAWDDPKEPLQDKFRMFQESGIRKTKSCRVYVLTNYWSSTIEDLNRIYQLRKMGFLPYVMIYDKQKFVDSNGRWLPDVADRYNSEQLKHFKICQHLQRWCGVPAIWSQCSDFYKYEPFDKWRKAGMPVPHN